MDFASRRSLFRALLFVAALGAACADSDPPGGGGGGSGGGAGGGVGGGAGGGTGNADAGERVRCGHALCAEGLVCCNESCGTCTEPGELCSAELCEIPTDCDDVVCDPGTECEMLFCINPPCPVHCVPTEDAAS
jgi:hypothetical protein